MGETEPRPRYTPATWEKVVAYVVGISIIALVGWLLVRNEKFADPNLVVALRIILSLAVAAVGATIPGFLRVRWQGPGILIRAGGALALFLLTYVVSPTVVKAEEKAPGVVSQAAWDAKAGWERGTTVVLRVLRDQAVRYPEKLSKRLGVPLEALGRLDAELTAKARQAHQLIFDEFEEEGHQAFLSENADPRIVNPAVRHLFAGVRVTYRDGSAASMDDATRAGREMHKRFFELVLEATLKGVEPLANEAVRKQLDEYLERRQAVTEAVNKHLVTPP